MTAASFAKGTITIAIQSLVATVVSNKIEQNFEIESTAAKVGATVVSQSAGILVSGFASIVTDAGVDKVVAWHANRKSDDTTPETE
jgi:hypothetical protein